MPGVAAAMCANFARACTDLKSVESDMQLDLTPATGIFTC